MSEYQIPMPPPGRSNTAAEGQPGASTSDLESQGLVSKYETTLRWRINALAASAYLLGPISGILLLMYETKNDFVRFHAYQSCLIFCIMLIFHVLFLAASSGFQYLFVTVDVALVLFFGYNAYIRADQLERFEAPIVGPIALLWSEQDAL